MPIKNLLPVSPQGVAIPTAYAMYLYTHGVSYPGTVLFRSVFLFSEANIRIGLIIWNGCIYLFRDHDGALAALIGHAFMDMCERRFFFIPIDVSLFLFISVD